jgi:hypothetical protein
MKINSYTTEEQNLALFKAFQSVALDIEGSNLENTGWMPSDIEKQRMDEKVYTSYVEEANAKNAKVIFKNISLQWDSCDCGDGYGCSHGSYVYDINIKNTDKTHSVEYTDGDSLEFFNNGQYCKIPSGCATIYDFIRMCQICEIELELSDYAILLLTT